MKQIKKMPLAGGISNREQKKAYSLFQAPEPTPTAQPKLCVNYTIVLICGKALNLDMASRYSVAVAPQWVTGRGNPYQSKATPDALSVFFIVVLSAHLHSAVLIRPVSMVALVGQLSGWPVPFDAGISTPISVTTILERGNSGGDSFKLSKEATIMVATLTPAHPEFVFLFAAVRRLDTTSRTPRMIRTLAPTEHAARLSLAGCYILSFAGRLPVQGVNHG